MFELKTVKGVGEYDIRSKKEKVPESIKRVFLEVYGFSNDEGVLFEVDSYISLENTRYAVVGKFRNQGEESMKAFVRCDFNKLGKMPNNSKVRF